MNFKIKNNDHTISGVLDIPIGLSNCPCLLMLHGTGSNYHEVNNAYDLLSEHLNTLGIATCRFDFIGSNESDTDYINYSIKNCLSDIDVVMKFLKTNTDINACNIHLLGFSQGASIALLYHLDIQSLILLNGCLSLDQMLSDEEKETCYNLGFVTKTFDWRTPLKISKTWLEEVQSINFLEEYGKCDLDTLIICSSNDTTVDPNDSKLIYLMSNSSDSRLQYIDDADHIFNIYDTNVYFNEVIDSISEWLQVKINKN